CQAKYYRQIPGGSSEESLGEKEFLEDERDEEQEGTSEAAMTPHPSTSRRSSAATMSGDYFAGHGRQTCGEIPLRRVSRESLDFYVALAQGKLST
ncbi:MAG: hypothetical protein LBQ32_12085, partial [Burkholderiaceae bacterium]|nr:hypothetical protein [Burkholderiaceae bacterium]